ncbi:hypothetical protein BROUX41_002360 [Berkeleyomyces rouxiae]|uniref:uncharacterized protein n=1 Tax=Berkeleyomyces rouxiae TaxID=2035830 RepID=UPI003B7B7EBD
MPFSTFPVNESLSSSPSVMASRTERRAKKDPGHLKYACLTVPSLTDIERQRIYEIINSGCVKGATKRLVTMELETTDSIAAAVQQHGSLRSSTAQRPGRPPAINEEMATRLRIALVLTPTATAEQLIAKTGCACSVRTVQRNMADLRAEADRLAEYVIEEFQHDIFDLRLSTKDIQIPRAKLLLAPAPMLWPAERDAAGDERKDRKDRERRQGSQFVAPPEAEEAGSSQALYQDGIFRTPEKTYQAVYQTPPYFHESDHHTPQIQAQYQSQYHQYTPQYYNTPKSSTSQYQGTPQHTPQSHYQQQSYPQQHAQALQYQPSDAWGPAVEHSPNRYEDKTHSHYDRYMRQ